MLFASVSHVDLAFCVRRFNRAAAFGVTHHSSLDIPPDRRKPHPTIKMNKNWTNNMSVITGVVSLDDTLLWIPP